MQACEVANIKDFIESLPNKLDTHVRIYIFDVNFIYNDFIYYDLIIMI